jgi:beta-galactosidase/beta-glucuronidase
MSAQHFPGGEKMTSTCIPRPEHPRPQFFRNDWINLNGEWSYTFDFGESGMNAGRELFNSTGFDGKITVPFCPESELSGVGHKDFIPAIWYHRTIQTPETWDGKRILLHFGAVDYECEVFVDGVSVGTHFGGTVSFTFDITKCVRAGRAHNVVVRVKDETRGANQPGGKQCTNFKSAGCSYTRTTGIWQTVWLEAVDTCGLKDIHVIPDFDGSTLAVIPRYHADKAGGRLVVHAKADGKVVAQADVPAAGGVPAVLALDVVNPWSIENPFLYDIDLRVIDSTGNTIDEVSSYAGLRKVHIEGNRVFLNNKPIYQRLVLDQGFYPDGIWTAPTDEALKNDIVLSMKAGFNGARLHQKVFEERFHYWADKLGYITWGESSSWGCDCNTSEGARNFISEWREIIVRDRNHPSIITWTPWNESSNYSKPEQHKRLHIDTYNECKDLDPTRPVNDTSGYLHHITDVWTVHNYQQDPAKLREILTPDPEKGVWRNMPDHEPEYDGQPYIIDEYGGIKWIPDEDRVFADNSWGYGEAPKTLDEFYARLADLTNVILNMDHICGYCYTQLTDVEQEQNGIYNYDRSEKFDMKRIASIFQKEAGAHNRNDVGDA